MWARYTDDKTVVLLVSGTLCHPLDPSGIHVGNFRGLCTCNTLESTSRNTSEILWLAVAACKVKVWSMSAVNLTFLEGLTGYFWRCANFGIDFAWSVTCSDSNDHLMSRIQLRTLLIAEKFPCGLVSAVNNRNKSSLVSNSATTTVVLTEQEFIPRRIFSPKRFLALQ